MTAVAQQHALLLHLQVGARRSKDAETIAECCLPLWIEKLEKKGVWMSRVSVQDQSALDVFIAQENRRSIDAAQLLHTM